MKLRIPPGIKSLSKTGERRINACSERSVYKGFLALLVLLIWSCGNNEIPTDATGVFEATEIIVSSEVAGKILSLPLEEGQILKKEVLVAVIDSTDQYLTKLQLRANKYALLASRPDLNIQLKSIEKQIAKNQRDKRRTERLLAGDAATQQQLDEINDQLRILEAQLKAQSNTVSTNVDAINAQSREVDVRIAQAEEMLKKYAIKSPITGTVLVKYAEEGELATNGKALFKMADLEYMVLRAYVTGSQLNQLKLGQKVKVLAEFGEDEQRPYEGEIQWISSKSEFTPKTITTQDERSNLVYAIKVAVKNDGYLKIGMYAGVKFKES
ncbi:HlyD family secretion protein [Xanthovirga aplysinae]|uniref:HlyD family secretion protein n=1 Tax=Xanthovirga aplysinae TaxID=2529853 RepID=UPI0012BC4283|nr:HlyD family efflux transporter periplasmic adaptor subunit [Xanthovirga aplysinae]MTI31618.1 HlyD family efflux transporter periplasmic adaptor subunit [Xanthovirga aplysinae]